jgi:hypothetical protein
LVEEEKDRFGKSSSNRSKMNAVIPLEETIGFSSYLRAISKVIRIRKLFF